MALVAKPTTLTPSSIKVQLPTNYISLYDFSQTYLPDTHDELFPKFGNQSILGMLSKLGVEMPATSEQFIWSEAGRLFTNYTDVARSGNVFTKAGHVFRKGETIQVSDADARVKAVITAVDNAAGTFTALPYKTEGYTNIATTGLTVWVDGSEFAKGTDGMEGSLETDYTVIRNKPIILKDNFEVTGSDATNIGWIKTPQGYFWHFKSEADTRLRWENRLELAMILGEIAEPGSEAHAAGYGGTEGMFEAIRRRGHQFAGLVSTITEVDSIVDVFNTEGKIADYMVYAKTAQTRAFDDMLGDLNNGWDGGKSYGIFDNKEKVIELGFKKFTRSGYSFAYDRHKMFDDPTLLGSQAAAAGGINFVMVPLGTKEVYEGQSLEGSKSSVPFLHIKYKSANGEDRRFKSWVTGSVGPVATNTSDKMRLSMLSERGMCLAGANNFILGAGA
jgi:hypothetical protein